MKYCKNLQKTATVLTAAVCLFTSSSVFAQTTGNVDLDQLILEQQRVLDNIIGQKSGSDNGELKEQLERLKEELRELRSMNRDRQNRYDAESAVDALARQIAELADRLSMQQEEQRQILSRLEAMRNEERNAPSPDYGGYDTSGNRAYGRSAKFLIHPGPSEEVSYTQDAINSQGNSTMVFRYAPNQLYTIYCRMGYLTDLAFHKGERISFVGGGDTAGWAVNSTTVDDVPHLYIKPVVESSDTNLIVTTDHHSYQLLLQTSDWYNPMVVWSYDIEDSENARELAERDARNVTSNFAVGSPDQLFFDYEIKGKGDFRPVMVFDDGQKMFIKFKRLSGRLPVLFGRERGKKVLSMLNYTIKDNCYIVDRVCSEAELRISDEERDTIRIRRNG